MVVIPRVSIIKQHKRNPKKIKESYLDAIFSKFIRNRDSQQCVRCGSGNSLACSHIYSRVSRSVRFEADNALTLCYRCHIGWAHRNPIEFVEFIKKHLGLDKYRKLQKKYRVLKNGGFTEAEKQKMIDKFSLR